MKDSLEKIKTTASQQATRATQTIAQTADTLTGTTVEAKLDEYSEVYGQVLLLELLGRGSVGTPAATACIGKLSFARLTQFPNPNLAAPSLRRLCFSRLPEQHRERFL